MSCHDVDLPASYVVLAYGCREDARYPNTAALGLHILIFIDALLQQKVELPKGAPGS